MSCEGDDEQFVKKKKKKQRKKMHVLFAKIQVQKAMELESFVFCIFAYIFFWIPYSHIPSLYPSCYHA